ncbi:MAG: alpha-galactosidase [Clostridia bacterium]|nr:alpha-galactosidase [Clostridia bacterium]
MAILFDSRTKTFFLDGKGVTYAFMINKFGYAEHLYYGKTIGHDDLSHTRTRGAGSRDATIPGNDEGGLNVYHYFPTELSFFGTGDYREPAVEVLNGSGDRLTELLYDSHEIVDEKPKINGMPSMRDGETLILHLKDRVTSFACDLYYTVYDDASVIARRAVYINASDETKKLNRAYSFSFSLPDQHYDVISLYGAWGKERTTERIPMHHGVVSIDSKRCASSAVLNPFMALADRDATEEHGDVYGFNLIYSSSYALKTEGINDGRTLVTGGINDFDFCWVLGAGERFETPEVLIAYSSEGIGGMSRALHDALRNHLINPRYAKKPRPIVINNWEGTYFNFTVDKLKSIAKAVEGTGIDTFVLDDGWFGKRDSDRSGLGDWFVNTDKLEGGLTEIIRYVNSLGMKFGLWFEPEMISEDSDIFRAHPEYAVGVPNRPRCYSRHQYMMDITRKEVRDYIVEVMNKVLHENNIEYVKWDYNRNITEFFSFAREPERQAEYAHRYALGLYELFDRIVEANPEIFFEGCSGGGARFDPAILYYFPQIWTSDNSDAEDRTVIQYGTSLAYPLSAMSCHVSEVPNHQTGRMSPLKTRADIAHLGATGYELDTSGFTDAMRAETKKQVEEYREMEELILNGDLYRTADPNSSNFFAFTVVSKDKSSAVLTAYRRLGSTNNEVRYLKVRGLDENKAYYIPELNRTLKGSTVMNLGLVANFGRGDYMTVKYTFKAVDNG